MEVSRAVRRVERWLRRWVWCFWRVGRLERVGCDCGWEAGRDEGVVDDVLFVDAGDECGGIS